MSLSQGKLDTIAKCAVGGMRPKEIAQAAGCSVATVTNLIKGGSNEQFDLIYAGWQSKALSSLVDHRWRLQEFLENAYQAVRDLSAPDARDLRLKWEVAKWLLENTSLTGHQPHQSVNLNVGIQNNVAGEQVAVAFGSLGKDLSSLMEALRGQRASGPDPHEKVGDEALPASYKLVADTEPGPGAKPNGRDPEEPQPPEGTPTESPGE